MLMGVLLACCARRARPMVCAARFGAQGRRAVGGAQCRAVGGGAAGDGAASASWLVIDGNSLIYRSFHGMPPLTSTKNNQPVGSVLGVTMALFRVALPYLFAGARVVFVLDPEEKGSWRKDLDPSYKSQRSPMPPMLKLQYNDAVGVAAAFGVSVVFVNGQEADDVLATLASRHRASGVDVWSGDKDLLQLVDMPGVRCLDYSGAHVDEAAVMVKFGVKASQIGDYLALVGDASDNVKGVAGIGAKGAAALLTAFGDLKTILERAPTSDLKTRIRNAVINADLEQLAISRQLVELNRDVELPDE
ncbi:PIN domain-like protein [Pelagophyceae sp. CCMP2097]|nr:PIN domain-like protein [Pelagophyceae sp. CCMP2097]